MSKSEHKSGFLRGTGAAVNVQLGWVPDVVHLINLTDGDTIDICFLSRVMAFTGGGTNAIQAGDKLIGNTNAGTFIVSEVIVDSGTWAGGDAAGWFIGFAVDITGTWTGETAYRKDKDAAAVDAVTITAIDDNDGVQITSAVAGTTTANTTIIAYQGVAGSASLGFTVGLTLAENAKLFGYQAFRNGDGESPIDQTTAP